MVQSREKNTGERRNAFRKEQSILLLMEAVAYSSEMADAFLADGMLLDSKRTVVLVVLERFRRFSEARH